tara:strand:- start:356 stop:637 length:282 start_codon:yes stop_codon:yes gene_type:complete
VTADLQARYISAFANHPNTDDPLLSASPVVINDNACIFVLVGKLGMFNLSQLKEIVAKKQAGEAYDQKQHQEIIAMLEYAAKSFDLAIPEHWR